MAVTTRVLELYHNNHLRCPHLAIQPFVKSLCDLHGKAFRPYLSQQFSICYDLYIQIRDEAKLRVDLALGRDTPQWRLQNACPACTYKLEGESKLIFDMLCMMDGNDSLKRILRCEPAPLTNVLLLYYFPSLFILLITHFGLTLHASLFVIVYTYTY